MGKVLGEEEDKGDEAEEKVKWEVKETVERIAVGGTGGGLR